MDIQPQTTQPISDDQELAKVLAGVNQQADAAAKMDEQLASTVAPAEETVPAPAARPELDMTATMPAPTPITTPSLPTLETPKAEENLGDVKKDAIEELRPLVDKLTLPAEEKFDLYLLLIRSTDDSSLIAPAHEAAKSIADDTRRAEALLDIIKEIDYLTGGSKEEAPAE